MATQEQIEALLSELRKAPPSDCFQNIDKNAAGFRAILQYLYHSTSTVTAGKISEHMNVSTARVAVLLKKMVAKGLIKKESDSNDARVVVVKLSEQGLKIAEEMHNSVFTQVGKMIDKIGMERMMEFAAIANEVHSIMSPSDLQL